MDTNTTYKVVEGDKKTFELESNKLAKEGYISFGQFFCINTEKGFFYTQLMTKYTPPE